MLDFRNCTQTAGFEARQIMIVSCQKSEASFRSYSRYVSDGEMHEMSLVLKTHMAGSVTNKSALPLLSTENRENIPPPTNVLLDIGVQRGKSSSCVFNFHSCTMNTQNN